MKIKPFVVDRIDLNATLHQISDAFLVFGLSAVVRLQPRRRWCPFLADAWQRKEKHERIGES